MVTIYVDKVISVNEMYLKTPRGIILHPASAQYQNSIKKQVYDLNYSFFSNNMHMVIKFYVSEHRYKVSDLDNFVKCFIDALVKAKCIVDDKFIKRLDISKHIIYDRDDKKEMIEFEVKEYLE
jgi:Holliday junction resolvase RusA-like endonuclease